MQGCKLNQTPALLTALGYSTYLDDHDLVINQDTGSYLNNLAGITTNLFDYRDNFRVIDVVDNDKKQVQVGMLELAMRLDVGEVHKRLARKYPR